METAGSQTSRALASEYTPRRIWIRGLVDERLKTNPHEQGESGDTGAARLPRNQLTMGDDHRDQRLPRSLNDS
jgi:hypothetical protein